MNRFFVIALALLTLGGTLEVAAQKKEKKPKKELKWEWDGVKSGNETIDKYLLTIDTLYNRVISYRDSVDKYVFKKDTLGINGKYYEIARMINADGQLVTQGEVNFQCYTACMDGLSIVLAMTNAGLQSANAALALPQLGLNALKFAKYVKGGPAVISQGLTTVKTIRGKWITNLKDWRKMKAGALSENELRSLGYFDDASIKKIMKCIYVTEIKPGEPEYQQVQTVMKNKTEEEKKAEAEAYAQVIANSEVAKEDARRTMQEVNDDNFLKEAGV